MFSLRKEEKLRKVETLLQDFMWSSKVNVLSVFWECLVGNTLLYMYIFQTVNENGKK